MGEIFRLLDHWRDRRDRGIDHLIWVPTCPLFKRNAIRSENVPDFTRPIGTRAGSLSDEEMFTIPQDDTSSNSELFVLPQSGDMDEADSCSSSIASSASSSSAAHSSNDRESIGAPVESPAILISHPHEQRSSE